MSYSSLESPTRMSRIMAMEAAKSRSPSPIPFNYNCNNDNLTKTCKNCLFKFRQFSDVQFCSKDCETCYILLDKGKYQRAPTKSVYVKGDVFEFQKAILEGDSARASPCTDCSTPVEESKEKSLVTDKVTPTASKKKNLFSWV